MLGAEDIALLGNIGEFVGSIAVLLTLIYLTVQTKQSKELLEENRKIALSQVFQTRVGFRMANHHKFAEPANAELTAKVAYSPNDVTESIARLNDLSAAEQQQFFHLQHANVQLVENVIYQEKLGLLDDYTIEMNRRFAEGHAPLWKTLGVLTERVETYLGNVNQ